jgi:hypothetical protein
MTSGVIIIIIGLVSAFYLWPTNINKTYEGYLYAEDGSVERKVDIHVEGILYRSLTLNHTIKAKVTVGDFAKEFEGEIDDGVFIGDYGWFKTDNGDIERVGVVIVSQDLEKIWVSLDHHHPFGEGRIEVYAPAKTKDEAIKVNKGLAELF